MKECNRDINAIRDALVLYFSLNTWREFFCAETETCTHRFIQRLRRKHMNDVWRILSLSSIVIKIGNVRARDGEASGRKGPIPRLGSQIILAARIAVRKFGIRRPLVRVRAK